MNHHTDRSPVHLSRASASSVAASLLFLIVTACGDPTTPAGVAARPEPTTIAISGALAGNVEPCGCGGNKSGGLEDMVATLRADATESLAWMDAGAALTAGPLAKLVRQTVIQGYVSGTIDCVAMGPEELLHAAALRAACPQEVVCANLDGLDIRPYRDLGRFRLTSVIDPELARIYDAQLSDSRLRLRPMDACIEELFQTCAAEGRIPIVSLHAEGGARTAILRWLAKVRIRFLVVDVRCRISSAIGIADYGAGKVVRVPRKGTGFGLLRFTLDQPDSWVHLELRKVEKLSSGELTARHRESIATAEVPPGELTKEHGYVGSATCVNCHAAEGERWRSTRHATAMTTLARIDADERAECFVCHTTSASVLPTTRGDRIPATPPAGLSDVGCEACHGPGQTHAVDRKPFSTQPRDTCRVCHSERFDPTFTYEHKIDFASCQGAPLGEAKGPERRFNFPAAQRR